MNYRSMTSSDIWNLFNSGKLDLDKLEKEDLDTIFDIEMEELERNSAHDMSLMEECARLLLNIDKGDVKMREFTIEDIEKIENDVLSGEQITGVVTKRHTPKRRLIPLVAAIVVIVATLTVVVAARFDWLGDFGLTIKDLFNMNGSVTSTGNKELYVGENTQYYESFNDLSNSLEFDIFTPSVGSDDKIVKIYTTEMVGYNVIYSEITTSTYSVIYTIYYGEAADDYYGNETTLIAQSVPSFEWNGYKVYHSIVDGKYQASVFKDSLIYVIQLDTEENIEHFLSTLE